MDRYASQSLSSVSQTLKIPRTVSFALAGCLRGALQNVQRRSLFHCNSREAATVHEGDKRKVMASCYVPAMVSCCAVLHVSFPRPNKKKLVTKSPGSWVIFPQTVSHIERHWRLCVAGGSWRRLWRRGVGRTRSADAR